MPYEVDVGAIVFPFIPPPLRAAAPWVCIYLAIKSDPDIGFKLKFLYFDDGSCCHGKFMLPALLSRISEKFN